MSRQRSVRLLSILAVLGLATCAPVLRASAQSAPDAGPVLSGMGPLAPEWRGSFLPDHYRSGNYICHAGHGDFKVSKDLSVSGTTTTWIGGLSGTFNGHIDADGRFTGAVSRDGAVVSRGEGRLVNAGRIVGTWMEGFSGCQGSFVAEPVPEPALTRPVYAGPKDCVFSGSPDQRFCDYTLADGTRRYVMLAQDILDRDSFHSLFGAAPPGYDRPDHARVALSVFDLGVSGASPGVTNFTTGFEAPRDLPYGALACLNNAFDYAGTDDQGRQRDIVVRERFCFQPLANAVSRFVLLEMGESRTLFTQNDARFERDADRILGSLRLP